MSRDIGEWLEGLGLGDYADAFAENKIDGEVLATLSNDDLKDIGVGTVGDRRRILNAIANLDAPPDDHADEASKPRGAEAERRQLTVMFVDLVGSTALSAALDPEDLREVMRRYQDAVAGAVTRYGGHVAKYLGDGVLAYFGWPQAHEDQAERAVRAGLHSVAAVGELSVEGGAELQARAGIATGQVVVGDLVGEAGRDEEAVTGETPNLAARLQDLAGAGQVAVGEATRHLLGRIFDLEDLGAHELKGFAEPVPAWRVTGERAAESRFEASHAGSLTNFVGREHEIGMLLERWERAKRGEGQVVLLSGEAGIGKSRITQSLRETVAGEPHSRVRYQCAPYYASTALYPFSRQFEFAAGFAPEDSAEAKLDKIEALLANTSADVAEVAALFAAALSIPTADRYPPLDMPPQRQKEKTLEAIGDQILGMAENQPVLVIFEDAHWADPTSLEALEHIIDRLQAARVMIVIAFRPEFVPPWPGRAHITTLTLNRLGREQCTAMVSHVTRGKALPGEVLDQIIAKTDGVPLFVEELTKTVLESGLLEEEAEQYRLDGKLPPLAIPSTLQDSLMARLDRLAPVKEVAQIGAAIGREFGHRLLAAVMPLDDNELSEAIDQLVESELVFRRGSGADANYIFKHALVQDVAYGSLLKSRRKHLHKEIAQALEREFPDTATVEPEILAHHCAQAGLPDEATSYFLRAGARAAGVSANAEAVEHLNKGLALVESLPEGGERDARELDLWIALINPLVAAVGYSTPNMERACTRALDLCHKTGDMSRIFPVLYGRWVFHYAVGQIPRCRELALEFHELAETQQDPIPRLVGHRIYGAASMINGDFPAAQKHLDQALAGFDPEKHESLSIGYGQDLGAAILNYLALNLLFLGFPDQAAARGREAVARAHAVDHVNTLAYTLWHVGPWLYWLLRDAGNLAKHTEELRVLSAESSLPMWEAASKSFRGLTLSLAGEPETALAEIDEALELNKALQFGLLNPLWDMVRGEILRDQDRLDEGVQAIDQGLALVGAGGEHWIEPELHRARGELCLTRGGGDEAEVEFKAAIDLARAQGGKWWELRAATSLARLWQSQKKTKEARDLLKPIHGWFTEGFDTADLKDAKALLKELG